MTGCHYWQILQFMGFCARFGVNQPSATVGLSDNMCSCPTMCICSPKQVSMRAIWLTGCGYGNQFPPRGSIAPRAGPGRSGRRTILIATFALWRTTPRNGNTSHSTRCAKDGWRRPKAGRFAGLFTICGTMPRGADGPASSLNASSPWAYGNSPRLALASATREMPSTRAAVRRLQLYFFLVSSTDAFALASIR